MAKLVKESLNEKFTQKSDPIRDMGIGNIFNIEFFMPIIPVLKILMLQNILAI